MVDHRRVPGAPEPGIYEHWKACARYKVLGIALNGSGNEDEPGTPMVIYQRLLDGTIWYRTVAEFTAPAIDSKGRKVVRFKYLG